MTSILQHLLPNLAEIVQSYLHNPIREEFYESSFKGFTLLLRLNKEINTIQELKVNFGWANNYNSNTINAFFVETQQRPDTLSSYSRWIEFQFVRENKRYYFNKCLTADIPFTRGYIAPIAANSYATFYFNILKLFQQSNKDALLAEILQQCQIIPIEADFERICLAINAKVASWISNIDFYEEIHR